MLRISGMSLCWAAARLAPISAPFIIQFHHVSQYIPYGAFASCGTAAVLLCLAFQIETLEKPMPQTLEDFFELLQWWYFLVCKVFRNPCWTWLCKPSKILKSLRVPESSLDSLKPLKLNKTLDQKSWSVWRFFHHLQESVARSVKFVKIYRQVCQRCSRCVRICKGGWTWEHFDEARDPIFSIVRQL